MNRILDVKLETRSVEWIREQGFLYSFVGLIGMITIFFTIGVLVKKCLIDNDWAEMETGTKIAYASMILSMVVSLFAIFFALFYGAGLYYYTVK